MGAELRLYDPRLCNGTCTRSTGSCRSCASVRCHHLNFSQLSSTHSHHIYRLSGDSFLSRLHLRSLKTGERHSRSQTALVEVDMVGVTPRWSYKMQVSGQHLGILYEYQDDVTGQPCFDKNQLVVWNWIDGTELMVGLTLLQSWMNIDKF